MATNREFLVGATVTLTMTVSEPGTKRPADPSNGCVLDRLVRGGVTLPIAMPGFVKMTDGHYVYALDTTGFTPGTYTWRGKASDAVQGVALVEDTFVLRAGV